jgi:hypothetical protein
VVHSNSVSYPNLTLGIAYDPTQGQWSLGYNGANSDAPPALQGGTYVGVSGAVVEAKAPLSDIGNPSVYYGVAGQDVNCCVGIVPPPVRGSVLVGTLEG